MKAKFNILLLLFILLNQGYAQNLDIDLLRKIHSNEPKKSDGFFKFLSNTVTPAAVATPCVYLSVGLYNKDLPFQENYYLKSGINSGVAILGTGLISYSTKYIIDRKRPYEKYTDIIPKMNPHSSSFPSGHTTFAFATATTVSLTHKKWYITVPMFLWASAVGYSRMHLGVHYPSDVLGGAVIGTGFSYLFYKLSERFLLKR